MKELNLLYYQKKTGFQEEIPSSRDNGSPIEQIIPLLQFLERVMGNKDKDLILKDDDL